MKSWEAAKAETTSGMPPTTRYSLSRRSSFSVTFARRSMSAARTASASGLPSTARTNSTNPMGRMVSWSILPTGNDSFSRRSASPI